MIPASVGTWEWRPDVRREAVVGEPLTITTPATLALVRQPPGSSATLDGSTLTCDAPGLHVLAASHGTEFRELEIVAFAAGVLTHPEIASVPRRRPDRDERLEVLRAVANAGAATDDAIARCLESGPRGDFGLCPALYGEHLSLRAFGAH